jgi:hypothetical protein
MATNTEKTAISEWTAAIGKRGGDARMTKMTPEERSRIAKLAAQARWAKKITAPDPNDPKTPLHDKQRQGPDIM